MALLKVQLCFIDKLNWSGCSIHLVERSICEQNVAGSHLGT